MIPHNDADSRRIRYLQLLQELEPDFEGESPQTIASIIEKIKLLEEFSLDKKRYFCLFDHKKFQPIYLSENVAMVSGYSLGQYYKLGLWIFFKHIHWKQLTFFYKLFVWGRDFQKLIGEEASIINNKIFINGVKLRDRWGKWGTICIKQKVLSIAKKDQISISFLEIEDITPLYKADFIWKRMSNITPTKSYCRVYFSSGPKKEYADLLSVRELEILQLIVQKKNSKEIGEELSISVNTVLRHRKNMIAKAGVTDMTALIYICRLCQIL